jgi:GNAT superfamily N-acetyltransferase
MDKMKEYSQSFEVLPLVTERWHDLEILFEKYGAPGDCWCMWFRLPKMQFDAQSGQGNKNAMKALVESGVVPGLIGYVDGTPAGWVSLSLREDFPRLERSRIMKAIDEQPVWSIVCLFIDKSYRKQGISLRLLQAAVEYAVNQGAKIVEGYPVDRKDGTCRDADMFHGAQSIFEKAGFMEVARRSSTRPVMRYTVDA